ILLLLLATIGLPYFLLSTTTPLLQAWYWRRFRSRVPYRLFALSNLASLLALIGFPLLFEPALDLRQLGWMWSFVFAGFVVLCALTARLSMNGFGADEVPDAARAAPLSMATQLQWLALLKPDPLHLTRYYLMISLGGALGAVLVAVLAPLTLPGYFELGIALVLLALLLVLRLRRIFMWGGLAVSVVTALLVMRGVHDYSAGVRVMERDFYGVMRTADHDSPIPYRSMYHGPIMHGGQLLGDSFRNTPADYFGPTSGYGRVFQSLREMRRKQPLSVGILGLGAGVVAAWMRPGDALVFYEISPRVVDI